MNEIGLVDRASIDGSNGLTARIDGPCVIGSNDIDEADVMIANDLVFDNREGNFLGTAGRSTFVHEFGHLFGFQHENAHGIMRASPPHLLTGGNESSTVWPTETMGVNAVYGLASVLPNLLPSALGVSSGVVGLLDSGVINVCRGQSKNVSFYVGNAGMSGTATYELRIRLSANAVSTGGTVAATFTHSLSAFTEGTHVLPFTVPSLPNGVYFIHLDLDHGSDVWEVREGDNSTVSGMRFNVVC